MNSTSASLNGSRPRPGGVGCRPDDAALAQALLNAAANSSPAAADRNRVLTVLLTAYRIPSALPPFEIDGVTAAIPAIVKMSFARRPAQRGPARCSWAARTAMIGCP